MTVHRFVTKPVEVEAMRFDGHNADEIAEFAGEKVGAVEYGDDCDTCEVDIGAVEPVTIEVGDWVIRYADGSCGYVSAANFRSRLDLAQLGKTSGTPVELPRMKPRTERVSLLPPVGTDEDDGDWWSTGRFEVWADEDAVVLGTSASEVLRMPVELAGELAACLLSARRLATGQPTVYWHVHGGIDTETGDSASWCDGPTFVTPGEPDEQGVTAKSKTRVFGETLTLVYQDTFIHCPSKAERAALFPGTEHTAIGLHWW